MRSRASQSRTKPVVLNRMSKGTFGVRAYGQGAILRVRFRIGVKEEFTVQYGQLPAEMSQHIVWLRERLLCWFERHGRSFPWREPGRSQYEFAVAEILLQRTRAAGVARAFPGLIARYPLWETMARASLEELQEALRPLGL